MSRETGDKTTGVAPDSPSSSQRVARGLKKLATGVAAAFGFVARDTLPGAGATDAGTLLAIKRTDLALERSYLAAERTLMAWIRTALAMISFGFTLGKLGQAMESIQLKQVLGGVREVSIASIAYFLVVLGTGGLLVATVQFRLRTSELQAMGLRHHFSIALTIGVLLVIVGGFAFTALVINL